MSMSLCYLGVTVNISSVKGLIISILDSPNYYCLHKDAWLYTYSALKEQNRDLKKKFYSSVRINESILQNP